MTLAGEGPGRQDVAGCPRPPGGEQAREGTGGVYGFPWDAVERPAQATRSTEFIVLGFLGQGFYLAWDLWHLLLMNVYS